MTKHTDSSLSTDSDSSAPNSPELTGLSGEQAEERGGEGKSIMAVSEKRGDVVYTPAWVAADMVSHFNPAGSILDPCKGAGAFSSLIPDCLWCEITEGSDFFSWTQSVDWVIGNPPYSKTREWFRHSYTIAEHLCYLVPLRNVFSGYGFVKEIHEFGGIREIRVYGTGGSLGFPMGNAVGVFHIQREYKGGTLFTWPTK